MDTNENVMLGYAIDPYAVYGSSLHQQVANRSDGGDTGAHIVEDSPVDGPQAVGDASASGGPRTLRGLLRSPVVLLIILLPLAYWLFNEVYA